MDRANTRFYWLSAADELAPAFLDCPARAPQAGEAAAVIFLSARPGEEEEFLAQAAGGLARLHYLVCVLFEPDAAKATRLLDQGADDVCSREELVHGPYLMARLARQAARKAEKLALIDASEAEAAAAQARLDALPLPIFFKDENAVYRACNKAFEALLMPRELAATYALVETSSDAITAGQEGGRQLRRRELDFRTLVENSPDFIVRYDLQGRRLYANPAMVRQFGTGRSLLDATPAEAGIIVKADKYMAQIRESLELGVERAGEYAYVASDGEVKCGHFHIVPEFDADGKVVSALSVGRDITEIVENRQKIQRLAFYDSLTGLPNRTLLDDSISQLASEAARLRRHFGLMMFDLDRFKEVNDTMGHAVGDTLLREVVSRLRVCVRASDIVARLGGDEFAILLPGLRRRLDFGVIAAKILRALAEPFHIADREINISASIGIAKFPKDSVEVDVLFKQADAAMYHAKRLGRNNFQFYSPEMMEPTIQRMMVETTLRKALVRGELEVYYQPQVMLHSEKLIGAEALLRWNHPELGFLTPNKFIGIAEETGAIVEIGRWVLIEACRAAVEWNQRRGSAIKVAVNLSSRQFVMNDLVASVREALAATGCSPRWLELEITEGLLLDDNQSIRAMLQALSDMDLSLAIDDFGVGYSALGYLTRFPIDTLKIDRSFIHEIDTEGKKLELVKAMIGIAKALDLRLVAEGVETKPQADFLIANGCDLGQGFLYGRPMPKAEFGEFLKSSALQNPFVKNAKRVRLLAEDGAPQG